MYGYSRWFFAAMTLTITMATSGCSPEHEDSDSGPVVVDTEEDEECGTIQVKFDGPDQPVVGDTWTVLLYCDDALLMGPVVIQVTPTSLATIDEQAAWGSGYQGICHDVLSST